MAEHADHPEAPEDETGAGMSSETNYHLAKKQNLENVEPRPQSQHKTGLESQTPPTPVLPIPIPLGDHNSASIDANSDARRTRQSSKSDGSIWSDKIVEHLATLDASSNWSEVVYLWRCFEHLKEHQVRSPRLK